MDKVKVYYDELMKAVQLIRSIDKLDLTEVIVVDSDGSEITIPTQHAEEWKFIGLGSSWYIRDRNWEVDPLWANDND